MRENPPAYSLIGRWVYRRNVDMFIIQNRTLIFKVIASLTLITFIIIILYREQSNANSENLVLTINTNSKIYGIDINKLDDTIVSVSYGVPYVSVWNVRDGTLTQRIPISSIGATDIEFSPDGNSIAVPWNDGTVHIIDVYNGTDLVILEIDKKSSNFVEDGRFPGVNTADILSKVEFSPKGDLLAANKSIGPTWIWRISDNKLVAILPRSNIVGCESTTSLSFSRDGKLLATACEWSSVLLWQVPEGKLVSHLTDKTIRRWVAADFSPTEDQLVTGSDGDVIQTWSINGTVLTNRMSDRNAGSLSLSFSPNGRYIATGGGHIFNDSIASDTRIRIWDMQTHKVLLALPGHTKYVSCLEFSSKGDLLVSGDANGIIYLWRILN